MTCAQICSFQDDLELTTFGLPLSKLHFDLLVRQNQLANQLQQRVMKDRLQNDYGGKSLDLRNNPWFFTKDYTIQPLLDDEDFYFLIETKVGQSKKLRDQLCAENQLFKECMAKQQI